MLATGDVYVLGPPTGGALVRVGALADFGCAVLANCGPTPWWPPHKVVAEFAKVFNPKQLPLEGGLSPAVAGSVWQQATRDGSIQYFETEMTVSVYGGKPLYGAFFIDPASRQICVTLVDRASGTHLVSDPRGYTGCSIEAVDWVAGRALGYMVHQVAGDRCYVTGWSEAQQTWDFGRFNCPL